MAKPKPHLNSKPASKGGSSKRKSKQKGKTQPKPPMQRVLVLRNNKRVLEWRSWE
jgi:hypothetical protein